MMKLLVLVLVPLFSSNLIQLIVCVSAALVLSGLMGATHGLLCFNFDFVSKVLIFLSLYLLILMYYSTHPLPNTKLVNVFVGLTLILVVLFSVNSVIYFYFCFELGLIPMALMILGWGHQPERLVATLYMLFYTFSTSFPFLVMILALSTQKFTLMHLQEESQYLWSLETLIFLLPFLVKMPMFFLHLWLPKAHVEAPAYGSMVLAGVLLKIGGYGIWRFSDSLSAPLATKVGVIAVSGGAMASLIALCQVDIKSLIAYSSVVHMGLVVYGLIVFSFTGVVGALMMMVAHGVSSSGLFCLATFSYERFNTRSLIVGRGSMLMIPSLSLLWAWLILMNLSAPPSWNLLAELLMTVATVGTNSAIYFWLGVILVAGLIFSLYLFTLHHHSELTPLYGTSSESIRELSVGALHSQWWLLSPVVFYLFE